MGFIKEPLNIDFYFDGKQMSDEDQKRVTRFIAQKKSLKNKLSKAKAINNKKPRKAAGK